MSDPYYGLVRKDVFPLVPPHSKKLLDIGGGFGLTSSTLKQDGKADYIVLTDLVADDHHEDVDQAYSGNLDDPAFLQGVIEKEGLFDTILCLDVLEHLREPWDVVADLHKCLVPGGVIVASIPNMRHVDLVVPLVFKGEFELTERGLRDRTHLRWFVKKTAIELMTGSGLKLEKVMGRRSVLKWHKWTDILTFGMFRAFFDKQYLILVRNS